MLYSYILNPKEENINSFVTLTMLDVYCWASVLLFLPLHSSFYRGIHLFFRRQITLWNVTVFNFPCHLGSHIPSSKSDLLSAIFMCVQTIPWLPVKQKSKIRTNASILSVLPFLRSDSSPHPTPLFFYPLVFQSSAPFLPFVSSNLDVIKYSLHHVYFPIYIHIIVMPISFQPLDTKTPQPKADK